MERNDHGTGVPASQRRDDEVSAGIGENRDTSVTQVPMSVTQCRGQGTRRSIELAERRPPARVDDGDTVAAAHHTVDDRDHSGDATHRSRRGIRRRRLHAELGGEVVVVTPPRLASL